MLIGYARVSTAEQDLSLQIDALTKAGCEKIFKDQGVSGALVHKPGLKAALDYARAGDALVVWRLDRLSRNFFDLQEKVLGLAERELGFMSIKESIDTTNPYGRLFFHIMGALAEFERDATRERTIAGMIEARKKGAPMGRPSSLDATVWAAIKELLEGGASIPTVATVCGVKRQSIYYRLTQEVPEATYRQFRAELAAGADREQTIERMGLFRPALSYLENPRSRRAERAA